MTEFKNPFDEKNIQRGTGVWDGRVVTYTEVKTETKKLAYGTGEPVLSPKTGEQSIINVLTIRGISEDTEVERTEEYNAGNLLPDGKGFARADGQPVSFHEKYQEELVNFIKGLNAAGFDAKSLFDPATGKQDFTKLTGARFEQASQPVRDKDGKVKKNKKGYDQVKYYPTKFVGYTTAAARNANTNTAETIEKGRAAVVALLEAAEGKKLTRAVLIRQLQTKLNGDTDSNDVLALISTPEFHNGAAWSLDGSTLSL